MSACAPAKHKQKDPKPRPPPVPAAAQRLKIVVRHLPPNLPEHIFWQSVRPWVTDDAVTWKVYHAGKLRNSAKHENANVPSRAYVAFKDDEALATFGREYDGHLFRDKAGNESQAVVEFAPFQKVPPEKCKPDARNATIDKDEDYLSFLESLKSNTAEHASLESTSAAPPPTMPTTTPLLEALKAAKSAQKDKEAIIRNHPHYKDAPPPPPPAKKTPQNQQAEARPAPLSRKARKAAAAAAQNAASPSLAPASAAKAASAAAAANPQAPAAPAAKATSTPAANPQAPVAAAAPRSTPRSPRSARHQGPKPPPPPPAAVSAPLPPKPATHPPASANTNTNADAASPAPSAGARTRKGRPVIGLGRHFEAALNGAVGPGPGPSPSGGKKHEHEHEHAGDAVRRSRDIASGAHAAPASGSGVPNTTEVHAAGSHGATQGPPHSPGAAADSHVGRPRRGRGRGRGAPRGG